MSIPCFRKALDSRRLRLHPGRLASVQSAARQRQERQIVRSLLNLRDLLPWFGPWVLCPSGPPGNGRAGREAARPGRASGWTERRV